MTAEDLGNNVQAEQVAEQINDESANESQVETAAPEDQASGNDGVGVDDGALKDGDKAEPAEEEATEIEVLIEEEPEDPSKNSEPIRRIREELSKRDEVIRALKKEMDDLKLRKQKPSPELPSLEEHEKTKPRDLVEFMVNNEIVDEDEGEKAHSQALDEWYDVKAKIVAANAAKKEKEAQVRQAELSLLKEANENWDSLQKQGSKILNFEKSTEKVVQALGHEKAVAFLTSAPKKDQLKLLLGLSQNERLLNELKVLPVHKFAFRLADLSAKMTVSVKQGGNVEKTIQSSTKKSVKTSEEILKRMQEKGETNWGEYLRARRAEKGIA